MGSLVKQRLNTLFRPYKAQFDRCPVRIKVVAILCVMYLSVPIDLFDILFPWMAFADDLFLAGILLKILHKYGGLEEEVLTSPIELLRDIFKRTSPKGGEQMKKVIPFVLVCILVVLFNIWIHH